MDVVQISIKKVVHFSHIVFKYFNIFIIFKTMQKYYFSLKMSSCNILHRILFYFNVYEK